jgi:hypothetical protein
VTLLLAVLILAAGQTFALPKAGRRDRLTAEVPTKTVEFEGIRNDELALREKVTRSAH